MRVFSPTAAALAAILAAAVPLAANANTGGVRIIVQQWNPAVPAVQTDTIVLDKPGLLGDALDKGWAEARTPVCNLLKAEAGQADRLGPGFTLYNIDCAMATSGTLTITAVSGNVVSMTYRLPGNMFKGTSTQPSDAGSYADPCAFFHYDLVAKTVLHLDTLAVDSFTASIENVTRPDSCNTAGDVAKFAAAALHFFGGPDFAAIAQHALERTQSVSTSKLNAAVASFVTPVQNYARQYSARQTWVRHGDLYFDFLPAYVPQPRSEAMSGTIRIQKNQWLSGVPQCAMFSLTGYVQTGPNPIDDPERMTVGPSPGTDVGVSTASGAGADLGDRYLCTYVESSLPAGVPIQFRGHGTPPAQRGHVQDHIGVEPDGWSGTVALTANLPNKNFVATLAPELVGFSETAQARRIDPVDPARTNPLISQSTTMVGNPVARISLNPQPLPPKIADALTQSGLVLYARGDFAGAAGNFTQAVAANPKNAIALYNLATVHARLGKNDLAKSEFQRAFDLAESQGDFATSKASQSAIIIVGGRH